jgi:hypothetical protein
MFVMREGNIKETREMGRAVILWLLGIPIPVLLLLWLFGFFH